MSDDLYTFGSPTSDLGFMLRKYLTLVRYDNLELSLAHIDQSYLRNTNNGVHFQTGPATRSQLSKRGVERMIVCYLIMLE